MDRVESGGGYHGGEDAREYDHDSTQIRDDGANRRGVDALANLGARADQNQDPNSNRMEDSDWLGGFEASQAGTAFRGGEAPHQRRPRNDRMLGGHKEMDLQQQTEPAYSDSEPSATGGLGRADNRQPAAHRAIRQNVEPEIPARPGAQNEGSAGYN